jgi:hypothetical protein
VVLARPSTCRHRAGPARPGRPATLHARIVNMAQAGRPRTVWTRLPLLRRGRAIRHDGDRTSWGARTRPGWIPSGERVAEGPANDHQVVARDWIVARAGEQVGRSSALATSQGLFARQAPSWDVLRRDETQVIYARGDAFSGSRSSSRDGPVGIQPKRSWVSELDAGLSMVARRPRKASASGGTHFTGRLN